MSGSGSREGFGSPPRNPAERAPELEETQTLPGHGHNGSSAPPAGEQQEPGKPAVKPETADQAGQAAASDDGDGDTAQPPGEAGPRRRPRRRRSTLVELLVLAVIAVALALVIKTFVVQPFYIPSSSMENTLDIGDRVLVNKLVYDFRGIHRGDIIVFDGNGSWDFNPPKDTNIFAKFGSELEGIVGISHDSSIYIKRVIGLPGDHVVCCNASGQITVNGVALQEGSYLYPGNAPSVQKFRETVPQGSLWVMGDHRLVSFDSRGHTGDPGGGAIPESAVIGRAFVKIWPPSRWGILDIPSTFEQPKLNASTAAAGGSSDALAAAMDNGTPLGSAGAAGSALPLALGFAGAVPLTWLQRRARRRLSARRKRRREARP
jgi:signal peptidase I